MKDIGCLLSADPINPRSYETILIATVKDHALVDERFLYSIMSSKPYEGSLYFAQMTFVHKTIQNALKLEV